MIDKNTGLLYVVKRPTPEKRKYSLDFSRLLSAIQSVVSVTASPSDLIVGVPSFTNTIVLVDLSEGTDGVNYFLDTTVLDIAGNKITERIMVKVLY